MFEQCEFTSAVNADDERMSLAQCFVDCSSLHAELLAFAYDLKIESLWMELESVPSHLAGCGKSLFLQEVGALAPT
jgi:hypothetical protein